MKIKAILENDNKGSTTFFTEKGRFTINYEDINILNYQMLLENMYLSEGREELLHVTNQFFNVLTDKVVETLNNYQEIERELLNSFYKCAMLHEVNGIILPFINENLRFYMDPIPNKSYVYLSDGSLYADLAPELFSKFLEEINYINQEIMKDPEQKYNFYDSIIDVVAEYINAKLDYLLMRESIEERQKEEEQYQEVLNKEIMEKIDTSLKDLGFEDVTFLSVNDIEEQKENLKLPYETQSVIDFINDLVNKNKRTLH